MASKEEDEEVEAKHGEKMITLSVRFWTDGIAEEEGKVLAKNGWVHGVVRMDRNDSRGIEPGKPIPFNSLLEIPLAIEELLIRKGVTIWLNSKMKKYVSSVAAEAYPAQVQSTQ